MPFMTHPYLRYLPEVLQQLLLLASMLLLLLCMCAGRDQNELETLYLMTFDISSVAKLLRNISDSPSPPGIPFPGSIFTNLPDLYLIYLTGYCEGLYGNTAGQTQMNITRCSVADINDSPVLPTVSLQGLGSLNDILSQVQNGIWELDNIKRVFFGMLVLVVVMMGVSLFRVMPLHRLLSTRQIKDLRQLTKVLTIVADLLLFCVAVAFTAAVQKAVLTTKDLNEHFPVHASPGFNLIHCVWVAFSLYTAYGLIIWFVERSPSPPFKRQADTIAEAILHLRQSPHHSYGVLETRRAQYIRSW